MFICVLGFAGSRLATCMPKDFTGQKQYYGHKSEEDLYKKSLAMLMSLVWLKDWKICDIYHYFTAANFDHLHNLPILCRSRTLFPFINVKVSVSNKQYLSFESVSVCL